jgi:GDPmannose 4,6-dehydratase
LIGDATKAKTKLGWVPKCSFEDLVIDMVDADNALLELELAAGGTNGF